MHLIAAAVPRLKSVQKENKCSKRTSSRDKNSSSSAFIERSKLHASRD
jgi:hypothetical protein